MFSKLSKHTYSTFVHILMKFLGKQWRRCHDKGHQRQFHSIRYGKNSVFTFLVYVDRQVLHVKLHPFFFCLVNLSHLFFVLLKCMLNNGGFLFRGPNFFLSKHLYIYFIPKFKKFLVKKEKGNSGMCLPCTFLNLSLNIYIYLCVCVSVHIYIVIL